MPRLMIKCPETRRAIYTGLMLTRTEFPDADLQVADIKCPHCGKTHSWSKPDAYLEGELNNVYR
jgi:hypothetical protein